MNVENDNLDLIEQLDSAGQTSQPSAAGWDNLIDRLPPRDGDDENNEAKPKPEVKVGLVVPTSSAPADKNAPNRRSRAVAMVLSLVVLCGVGFVLFSNPGKKAFAASLPIEVQRRGVAITVFNAGTSNEPTLYSPIQEPRIQTRTRMVGGQLQTYSVRVPANERSGRDGMLLVKDQRLVLHLKRGDNEVRFTDVAATIDPTSVRLVSDTDPTGTAVIEQNFEFDLANADALLKRAIESEIQCVGQNGSSVRGFLLSFDSETVVLADKLPDKKHEHEKSETQTIPRSTLQAVRLATMPDGLFTRPTLVWTLRTDSPGDHETTLTYLCGKADWFANYVAILRTPNGTGGPEKLDLQAWVTVHNRSGASYEKAGLKLIAGDVNRVRDPWAPAPPRSNRMEEYFKGMEAAGAGFSGGEARKQFVEKSFFEYKLYTLSQPSTVRDQQTKQLSLFKADGITANRMYVVRNSIGSQVEARLTFENEEENALGRALPKGQVTVTGIDDDGDSQLLTRLELDHSPKGEDVELSLGNSFDVTKEFKQTNFFKRNPRTETVTHHYRVRNHRDHKVRVRIETSLPAGREWKIVNPSDQFTKHDQQTLRFEFDLEPDSEKKVTYTVDSRW